ncbi:MAG: hypothetical protein ACI814_003931, partial [Mariniblastus sp.]
RVWFELLPPRPSRNALVAQLGENQIAFFAELVYDGVRLQRRSNFNNVIQ